MELVYLQEGDVSGAGSGAHAGRLSEALVDWLAGVRRDSRARRVVERARDCDRRAATMQEMATDLRMQAGASPHGPSPGMMRP